MDNQQDLLYSTWNSAQCYVAAWMGGRFGGELVHVYVCLSPFDVHLKLSQCCLLISYISIQNKKFKERKWKKVTDHFNHFIVDLVQETHCLRLHNLKLWMSVFFITFPSWTCDYIVQNHKFLWIWLCNHVYIINEFLCCPSPPPLQLPLQEMWGILREAKDWGHSSNSRSTIFESQFWES